MCRLLKHKILPAVNTVSFTFFAEICCNSLKTKHQNHWLGNIVGHLSCRVENPLDSTIAGHLNWVLVNYLSTGAMYYNYVTGIYYKLQLILKLLDNLLSKT